MKTFNFPPKKIIIALVGMLILLFLLSVLAIIVKYQLDTNSQSLYAENIVVEDTNPVPPVRLLIPKINVDAKVEHLGLTSTGAMDVPRGPDNVGWYEPGTMPGAVGSSVMDGHASWRDNIPAVFDNLGELRVGDKIFVESENGTIVTFVVTRTKIYKSDADTTEVFNSTDGKAHLNLITCTGLWDEVAGSSTDRLVVFSEREIDSQ